MILIPLAVFFSSAVAALATGAGVAAIPVIIHLWNKRRFRVVNWAAMRFLLTAQKQTVRRLRLEQWLVLAVRILSLLTIAAAMTAVTPWAETIWDQLLPSTGLSTPRLSGRTHKIIVIDGSLSMTQRRDDGTAFEHAKSLAEKLVNASAGGDAFSVMLLAAPSQLIVPGPSEDTARVAAEIEKLRCTHGSADLSQGLQLIESLLRKQPNKYAQREVYFITDLQRSTWAAPATQAGSWMEAWQRIYDLAQIVVLDVASNDRDNLAVSDLAAADPLLIAGTRTALTCSVHNYSPRDRHKVRVELLVGKSATGGRPAPGDEPYAPRVVQQSVIDIPAAGAATVAFPWDIKSAGEYLIQA